MSSEEVVDAVVVGARCAGAATATALARAGRPVVAVDGASFPSDTLSTHLLFAGSVAELKRLGALDRVEQLGAPRMPEAIVGGVGVTVRSTYSAVEGIDYAMCVRRPGLDAALVETAREAGAEVRDGVRVKDLVRAPDGRVTGVVVSERGTGGEHVISAKLVVGADGRRSTVAKLVGVEAPYRSNPNGRGCYFAYWSDVAGPDWRATAAQWREGPELGTAFPCDGDRLLVLLMPPVERVGDFKGDPSAEYDRSIDLIPDLAERLRGCERQTKVRFATDLPSFFRRSSGPGWALPGDAGHFKDPVTAQGIRDALRFGRLLGEAAAPALDDARALDAALATWERTRERECLETYHWTNRLARAESISPLEAELYRHLDRTPADARKLLDVFSRTVKPSEAFPLRLAGKLAVRALRRAGADRGEVVRVGARELRLDVKERVERARSGDTGSMKKGSAAQAPSR